MFQGVSDIDVDRRRRVDSQLAAVLAVVCLVTTQKRNHMKNVKRLISSCLIVCITAAGFPMAAQASIIATDEITFVAGVASSRDKVNTFMARDDVRQAMLGQGVSPQAALERVNAMSDVEVAQLAGRIDQAPAGGDVLGILFTVFIILLVTDIMGLTKVFPFTRSVR